ncbi:MAG: hypothetical protein NT159_23530 [Proteobacteria bacterium]|nr:hypothetical protein [Pseudomonadota bacterium]
MWTDPPAVIPLQHSAENQALEHRQLIFDNKHDLDRAIETALRYGWTLLSRSYSSEKGHGADFVRSRMNKAA